MNDLLALKDGFLIAESLNDGRCMAVCGKGLE